MATQKQSPHPGQPETILVRDETGGVYPYSKSLSIDKAAKLLALVAAVAGIGGPVLIWYVNHKIQGREMLHHEKAIASNEKDIEENKGAIVENRMNIREISRDMKSVKEDITVLKADTKQVNENTAQMKFSLQRIEKVIDDERKRKDGPAP